MEIGSLADWVQAGAASLAVVGGLASFGFAMRDRVRDQASRVVVRYLESPKQRTSVYHVEIDNTSSAPIYDPVIESYDPKAARKIPKDVFDMLDAMVDMNAPLDAKGAVVRRLSPGETQAFTVQISQPTVLTAYFLDSRQRAWRFNVHRARLRRTRRSKHRTVHAWLDPSTVPD